MPVSVRCSACGKSFRVKDELSGKTLRCLCGVTLEAPPSAPGDDLAGPASSGEIGSLAAMTDAPRFQAPTSMHSPFAPAAPAPRASSGSGNSTAIVVAVSVIGGVLVLGGVIWALGSAASAVASRVTPRPTHRPAVPTRPPMPSFEPPASPDFTPPRPSYTPASDSRPLRQPTFARKPVKPLSRNQRVLKFEMLGYRSSGDPTTAARTAAGRGGARWVDVLTVHVDVDTDEVVMGLRGGSVDSGPIKEALERAGFAIGRTTITTNE